ncbi:MAG: Ig-like domain-containing protein, partial [Eubacteriales bacterium]|nr:Ig-like domain-containing protein [Eubacteriales bacterium]
TIPSGVTTINNNAFAITRYTDCTFPAGVSVVTASVLQNNNKLVNMTFKGSITSFGNSAFSGCSALRNMTFEGKTAPTTFGTSVFNLVTKLNVFYPANGTGYDTDAFKNAFPTGTTFTPVASKPVATGLSISGKGLVGNTLQGSYSTFTGAGTSIEAGSTATWRRADDSAFTTNVTTIQTVPISAGTKVDYTLTPEDNGKYIQFSVTPRSNATEYSVGDEVSVVLKEKVRIPNTVPTVTLLSPREGYKIYQGKDIQLTADATCDNTTITKVEYYANGNKVCESNVAPFAAVWSGAEVVDYTVFARAYNALSESADSPSISMRVADLSEQTEPIVAKKWDYNFNQFTSSEVYTSTTGITLPGAYSPVISISSGGTVQSANGMFGKATDDYHLQINSINGSMTPATINFNIDRLDMPINNIVASMDVAFSTTNETRYVFAYQTPAAPYNAFIFSNDGKIKYQRKEGSFTFKDENGNDLTYEVNKWYHVEARYDFIEKTLTLYMDGEKLSTINDVVSSPADYISTSFIRTYGIHAASQTGIVYADNLFLGQMQESYVTSVMTSPIQSYNLKGSAIKFEGYAKDSNDKEISRVEFYANDTLIAEKTGSTYSFTLSNLPCGNYDIVAKAINSEGQAGYSNVVHIVVDGIFLPRMYSDGMLLQRNKPISIAGTGINGVTVDVALNGATASTEVKSGKWKVTLPAQPATKSTTLTISTSEGVTTVFKDVAIGELIMCSGQSNMAYALTSFSNLLPLADKTYEDIRLFVQPETSYGSTKDDIPLGYWTVATPSAACRFSAVGFLSGRDYYLSQNGEVPVGLIKGSVGGSTITKWVDAAAYNYDPDLAADKQYIANHYNGMIYPWRDYTIGSVLWYQGESDTRHVFHYEKMMTALINSWRNTWKDDSLNFVVIQLPIFNFRQTYKDARDSTGVREGQYNVSKTFDNVVTVISVDTGHATGIHPSDKLPISVRSSLALQHLTNPSDATLIWKSPSYDHFMQEGDLMTIYFNDVAGGLKTIDDKSIKGFKIAGDDGVFRDIEVSLTNNTILVDTSSVTGTPKVRYAWEDSPALVGNYTTLNLVNSANLPMAPFRTDRDRNQFKSIDVETLTLYDPYNFTPSILWVTASGIANGESIITVNAKDYDDDVAKVEVYADSILLGEATRVGTSNLFKYRWDNPQPGRHILHAIATDTAGATSIKRDITFGASNPINPQKFEVLLEELSILPFEDLSGKVIDSFYGENGVAVSAEFTHGSAILLIAAYDGNKLISMKSAIGNSVSFTAAELSSATSVKAFLFRDSTNIEPLCPYQEILKN